MLLSDLARAAGVDTRCFKVVKLSPGSVVVDLIVFPFSSSSTATSISPSMISAVLQRQAASDTVSSPLKSGALTCAILSLESLKEGTRIEQTARVRLGAGGGGGGVSSLLLPLPQADADLKSARAELKVLQSNFDALVAENLRVQCKNKETLERLDTNKPREKEQDDLQQNTWGVGGERERGGRWREGERVGAREGRDEDEHDGG